MGIVLFCVNHGCWKFSLAFYGWFQFVIFKLLSYCLEETKGFDVKASFARCPVSRLIGWSKKSVYITKEFWEKAIQFHGTFHGLKITNWFYPFIYFYTISNRNKTMADVMKKNWTPSLRGTEESTVNQNSFRV